MFVRAMDGSLLNLDQVDVIYLDEADPADVKLFAYFAGALTSSLVAQGPADAIKALMDCLEGVLFKCGKLIRLEVNLPATLPMPQLHLENGGK